MTAPTTVKGSGQKVYWQRCTINVYEAGYEKKKPIKEHKEICNGEGIVPEGTSLLFLGEGLVKEVSGG